MLKLVNIKKDYPAGAGVVHALKGIDLCFRSSEFVSILGPSGCGKTTLLNIIGGLDGYTEGDLIINGTSTKEYKDRDWDAYRNHSVGFVFQSYNLIPHQTVLANVELALTLSGVPKAERRARAIRALEEVGLGDQLKKRPSEMSGGQMQRVAIARALVNEPDIILADEPTGALDTETSVQVMEILKKVSESRLVVMVTHNPELAEQYSSRIIRMLDGNLLSDSAPLTEEEMAEFEAVENEEKGACENSVSTAARRLAFPIALHILLSFVTFGIWDYIRTAKVTAFTNLLKEAPRRSPAKAVLLSIFFPEIYLPIWNFKTAKRIEKIAEAQGISMHISVLCLVMSFFVPLVPFIVLQVALNSIASTFEEEVQETAVAPVKKVTKKREKKPSMSFATAFMLSLKNLFTKKGRTTLTAFAGSIGIIGIALILSVSQGTNAYIGHVQETTLSSYPLTLEAQTIDMTAMLESFMSKGSKIDHDNDAVYKDPVIAEMVNALAKLETSKNDLNAFKAYLEKELEDPHSKLHGALSGIQYTYDIAPIIYTKNQNGDIIKSDTGELMMEMIRDFMIKAGTANAGMAGSMQETPTASPMMSSMMGMQMWQELLPGLKKGDPVNDMLEEQYDLVYGAWPNSKEEIVLVLNEKNELDDLTLYALGLLSREDIDAIIDAAAEGKELPPDDKKWSYEEICAMTFRAVMPYDCYTGIDTDGDGDDDVYQNISNNKSMMSVLYNKAMELRVVGIIRPDENAESTMLSGAIGYTHLLTEHIVKESAKAPVVMAQLANPTVDVLTGLPFESVTGSMSDAEKETELRAYLASLSHEKAREAYITIQALKAEAHPTMGLEAQVNFMLSQMGDKDAIIAILSNVLSTEMNMTPEQVAEMFEDLTEEELKKMLRPALEEQVKAGIRAQVEAGFAALDDATVAALLTAEADSYTTEECAHYYDEVTEFSPSTYEERLVEIGSVDLEHPASINLYASSFENKDLIKAVISDYNKSVDKAQKIAYTDFLGIMMSSITTIIDAITYVLVAFVAISLIVSSIMIGVITLISVQERTKEIGILRAIGASKRNVSSMFNAETMIIGFTSGLLGVVVTWLLCLPINLVLKLLLPNITGLQAFLPLPYAIILVVISVLLTLISGIIPSRSAAKKDPVVALRTE